MPQRRLLTQPPHTDASPLPQIGPETWLDTLLHRAGVATGVSEQRPHDLGDALAAAAGILGIGDRILRRAPIQGDPRSAKVLMDELESTHTIAPSAEFVPVGGEGAFNAGREVNVPSDPVESAYRRILKKKGR